jgi:hypothetical protein
MSDISNTPMGVSPLKRLGVYATVIFAAFMLGFLPMWLVARTRANERDAAQQALRLAQLENKLAAAALHAQRGDYEPAREAASTFYTDLQAHVDRSQADISESRREPLQLLLARRDEVITLLARADPASAQRLADDYATYRRAAGPAQGPGSGP